MLLLQVVILAGVAALAAISVAIYIAPASSQINPSGLFPEGINPADVAWTLTATSLQLLLMAGNGRNRSRVARMLAIH